MQSLISVDRIDEVHTGFGCLEGFSATLVDLITARLKRIPDENVEVDHPTEIGAGGNIVNFHRLHRRHLAG